MEEPKNTSKQEKHSMAIRIGGGGGVGVGVVGGVVVWGGVVAVATFLSVSAIRLRRKRPADKTHKPPPVASANLSNKLEFNNSNNNDDDEGKGLRVLLQDYSPPIDYHPSTDGMTDMSVTQIDSTSLAFTKSSILDDNPVLDISGQTKSPTYLEILLSDNSKPKNSLLITDYGVNVQEYALPVLDGPSFIKPGNENKNEPIGDTMDVEVTEVRAEDKTIEAPHVGDQFAEDDNPPMQLIGKGGEGEEHDGENFVEIGEEEVIETAQMNQFAVEGDLEVAEAEDSGHMQSIETIMEKGEEAIETAEKNLFDVQVDRETIITKEEAANEAADAVQTEAEDNPEMPLIGEEQEYDEGGNTVEEDEAIETIQTDQNAVDHDEPQVTLSEDEAKETIQMDQDAVDHDEPQMTLSEDEDEDDEINVDEEEDEDEEEEEIVEKGEESSDGTGDSSMEKDAVDHDEPQMTLSEDEDKDEDDDEIDVDEDENEDEDEDEDEEEEEIVEKGEESSDGTGDSSMESNAEAIWPAESMQELSLELKELNIINKTLEDKIGKTEEEHGCYNSITNESNSCVNDHQNNEDTDKSIMTSSKGTIKELLAHTILSRDASNMRIWIWVSSVLLVLLLLVVPLLASPADIV